jgi:PHD/YefM family antitoxin component YafN of YafNO toxin-antitoxin module
VIHIRPVSDLRNKFPEIEDLVVREGEPVYLTKNGYGFCYALFYVSRMEGSVLWNTLRK